jgi:hypothetical protein
MKKVLLSLSLAACVLILLYSCSFGASDEGPRVLFIGNSFTIGGWEPIATYNNAETTDLNGYGLGGIPGIFKKLADEGGFQVSVFIEAEPGVTLEWHYANRIHLLEGRDWDTVLLQEYSTRPLSAAHGGNVEAFRASVAAFRDRIAALRPTAEVRLFGTWARPDLAADGTFPDIDSMQDELDDAIGAAAADYGLAGVSPVGRAFLLAVRGGLVDDPSTPAAEGPSLWAADSYHASVFGAYLAAAVFYADLGGRDPRLLEDGYDTAATGLGILPEIAAGLREIAWEAVRH